MKTKTDIIIYFIKLFATCIYTYYCFEKIGNSKKCNYPRLSLIVLVSLMLGVLCTYIKFFVNSFLSMILLCFTYGVILSKVTKMNIGYSLINIIISYAITVLALGISVIIEFIPYRLFYIKNGLYNLLIILLIQFSLLYGFFKIKRFKNGFSFLYKKFNNDITDIVMINISIAIILTYCLLGTIREDIEVIRNNMMISFIVLIFTMIAIIQKSLTMFYKQKLLEDTLKDYEIELAEKEIELEKIKSQKFNISKITHEFYNRQKSLQYL